jgi:Ca-activated chloride channel family protein
VGLPGTAVLLWLASGCAANDGKAPLSSYPSADAGGPPSYGSRDASASRSDGYAPPVQTIPEEQYGKYVENDFIETATEPTSTFSIDVDTASYSLMRQMLSSGTLPDPDGVRVEEYVNYFHYTYPQPQQGPFSINMEGAPSSFGDGYHLLRVGLQGLVFPEAERKPANLVFLIDVSGSMGDANKLPLVKSSLAFLVQRLLPTDTLGIVTYASSVSVMLQPTAVQNKTAILGAINSLQAPWPRV